MKGKTLNNKQLLGAICRVAAKPCSTRIAKEDKTNIWTHGGNLSIITFKLSGKLRNLRPGKRVQALNYDTEHGKISCNGICLQLFCLLSEVLGALSQYSRECLAFIP